jgi:hypothetical protein
MTNVETELLLLLLFLVDAGGALEGGAGLDDDGGGNLFGRGASEGLTVTATLSSLWAPPW